MEIGLGISLTNGGLPPFYPDATLALDFLAGAYRVGAGGFGSPAFANLPNLTVTRATPSVAYGTTSGGVLVPFAANVARITDQGLLVEEARTNSIRNNTMAGATASTFPTSWATAAAGGITPSVVGTGTEFGLTYIDVQLAGTPSSSATVVIAPDGFTANSGAAQNQLWTASTYARIIAGSLTNLTAQVVINENTSGGIFNSSGGTTVTPTASFGRHTHTRTLASATTAGCYSSLNFAVTNAQAVNLTIRLYLPQLELGAFVTSPIPTTSASVTRAADSVSFASMPALADWTLAAQQGALPTAASNMSFPRFINATGLRLWRQGAGSSAIAEINSAAIGVSAVTAARSRLVATATGLAAGNGVAADSGTPGAQIAFPSSIFLGSAAGATNFANAYLEKLLLYPTSYSQAATNALSVVA